MLLSGRAVFGVSQEAKRGAASGRRDVETGTRESTAVTEEEEDEEEEAPHATAQDREVAPAPASAAPGPVDTPQGQEAPPRQCCSWLTFSAWTVSCLDLAEAVYAIYVFIVIGWRNAFVAGFILKWGLLIMCIFFGARAEKSGHLESFESLSLRAICAHCTWSCCPEVKACCGVLAFLVPCRNTTSDLQWTNCIARARCCNLLGCCGLPLQQLGPACGDQFSWAARLR
eukprot:s5862_g2.t1